MNPSHEERHMIRPPPEASPEEYHCQWYSITDKVSYLPAGMYTGKVSFKACFHDLATGLQTHVYAPMGLDIKEKWTVGGNLPHEPVQPAELGIGAPLSGLYLREDIELKCNFIMTRFVRKTLKDSLATLVARLLVKSQLQENIEVNRRLTFNSGQSNFSPPTSPQLSPPLSYSNMSSPPTSPPHTTYSSDNLRPEWAREEQQRYSMKSYHSGPITGFMPHRPEDYNYNPARFSEMEAKPKPPAELP